MGRKTVLLVVAVVIATLGATLVYLYVRGVDQRAIADQVPVEVLTVTQEIAPGETLDAAQAAGKLALTQMPSDSVLPGALTDTESISDSVALVTMVPGEQVIASKWGADAAVSSLGIPEDRVAISAQLGDPNRVAGFVQPGSKVAIWWTGAVAPPGQEESDEMVTDGPQAVRLLLPEVTVLGTGDTTMTSKTVTDSSGVETTESLPKTLLTVSVTQEEAQKIILGGKTGELWFGLRSDDSEIRDDGGLLVSDLFD